MHFEMTLKVSIRMHLSQGNPEFERSANGEVPKVKGRVADGDATVPPPLLAGIRGSLAFPTPP